MDMIKIIGLESMNVFQSDYIYPFFIRDSFVLRSVSRQYALISMLFI